MTSSNHPGALRFHLKGRALSPLKKGIEIERFESISELTSRGLLKKQGKAESKLMKKFLIKNRARPPR